MIAITKTHMLAGLIGIVLVVLIGGYVWSRVRELPRAQALLTGQTLDVMIARTPQQQAVGLGGRSMLGRDEGMFFPYATKAMPTFWMKGMRFPIDIIWLANGSVIGIEKNILPPVPGQTDDQLERFTPPVLIDGVLEVNAGWTGLNRVRVGDRYTLNP